MSEFEAGCSLGYPPAVEEKMMTSDTEFKFTLDDGYEYVMSVANGVVLVDALDDGAYADCFTAQLHDLDTNPRIAWDSPEPPDEVKDAVRGRLLG